MTPRRGGGAFAGICQAAWVGYWRAMMRYHRYEVHGLSHLPTDRAALIVGYHGVALARDLCMLSVEIHGRWGYLPHAVANQALFALPGLRAWAHGMGFVAGDGPELRAAIRRGEHLMITPGGVREAARSYRHRYQVDWGARTGYLRLALLHRLPIVPVASAGVDEAYLGLNDGYRLGKRVGAPAGVPPFLALGPLGPWPLSPPFPVRIRQLIGAPLEVGADPTLAGLEPADPAWRDALLALHRQVTGRVQSLLDEARGRPAPRSAAAPARVQAVPHVV